MYQYKVFYLLLYISFTTHHFLNIYFHSIGLSGIEIGSIKALSAVIMIISQPIWGIICDLMKCRINLMKFLLIAAGGTFFLISFTEKFLWIMLFIGIYSLFKSPIVPVIDSIVMIEVKGDSQQYSQIRLWGGIGLTVSVVLMGYYFNQSSLDKLFLIYSIFSFLAFIIAWVLPSAGKHFSHCSQNLKLKDFIRLLKYSGFWKLLLAILFLQTGAFIIDGFFSLYVKERVGNEITLGIALTLAGFSEMVVYYYIGKKKSIQNPKIMLAISGITSMVRWYLYGRSNLIIQIYLLQLLHGISFGFFYISAVTYVNQLLNKEFATSAQTLLWAVAFGVASVLGSVLGGYLYDYYNFSTLFTCAAVLAGIAVLMISRVNYQPPSLR